MENLFEILSRQTDNAGDRYEAVIDGSHPVLAGHFPGTPVMPGVCSIFLIRECASRSAGIKLRYGTVKECKFLAPILPGSHERLTVTVSLTHGNREGEFGLYGEIKAAGEIMVKIKAVLIAE